MIARAGSGHIGSSFSSLDIISWLLLEELDEDDIFFSSKGHDAPGYYAALIGMGRIDFDLIHKLRRFDGLPGHPDIGTPGVVTNTGSLGMGVSKAKGMIFANRLAKRPGRAWGQATGAGMGHDRRRRASGGPILGVTRLAGQFWDERNHGHR